MTEAGPFAAFIRKWVAEEGSRPSTDEGANVEKELSLSLPAAYRDFVLAHGAPSTTLALLHSIVEGHHDLHDVSEFIPIRELGKVTALYEAGGMKQGYLAFASDSMGNLFLFKKSECRVGVMDAPVWFFDHDFVTIDLLRRPSCGGWKRWLLYRASKRANKELKLAGMFSWLMGAAVSG